MSLKEFHFLRPEWFIALLPLAGILWYLARRRFGATAWSKVCDPRLLPFVLISPGQAQRKMTLYVIALGAVLAMTALAGPVWERIAQPSFRDDAALLILFDLSASMNAVDIKPSRIVRARYKINDLLNQYKRGQVALMVYSDQAFPVVPLTHGREPIKKFLQAIETGLLPTAGSKPAHALEYAQEMIERNGLKRGSLLLVTDFADDAAIATAQKLSQQQFSVSVLGTGTLQGSPIFMPSGKILKSEGKVVISKLKEAKMRKLANAGKGIYQRLDTQGNNDVKSLVSWANRRFVDRQNMVETDKLSDAWREEGPWLLLLLLPLVLPVFRKGLMVVLVLLTTLGVEPVQAFEWKDLWLRADQQGAKFLEQGDAAQAAEQFEDLRWKGVAQYRNGDFPEATETFEGLSGAKNLYNKGNAQVHASDLSGAIESYNAALELDPAMQDALHNRGIVQQIIEERQKMQAEASEDQEPSDEEQDQQAQQQDQKQQDEKQDSDVQESTDEVAENQDNPEENQETEAQDDEASEDPSEQKPMSEQEQALEQALQGIQDDTQSLLRRKFQQQSRRKKNQRGNDGPAW